MAQFYNMDQEMTLKDRRTRGFTLIELLVVIAIIGLLSSVVLASLGTARAKARDSKRAQDLRSIHTALELFYADNGRYPTEGDPDNANNGADQGKIGAAYTSNINTILEQYMNPLPSDPLDDGTNYFYYYDGRHNCENAHPPPDNSRPVIFARTMESSVNANWLVEWAGPGTEPGATPPGANTRMIGLEAL